MTEYVALVKITPMEEKNEEFREKHVPMSFCSPTHRLASFISLHETVSVMCHTLLKLTDTSAGMRSELNI